MVEYKNARFDGCPQQTPKLESKNQEKYKLLYQGNSTQAFDVDFDSFTEYFYRVTASNNQGTSASEWMLIRTPDGTPSFQVDISLLNAVAISGYQIKITNMKSFCIYCDSATRPTEPVFTGIIVKFELIKTISNDTEETSFPFYCLPSCANLYNLFSNDSTASVLNEPYDSRLDSFFIDVDPVTTYNLSVRVCNNFSCVQSKGFLTLLVYSIYIYMRRK